MKQYMKFPSYRGASIFIMQQITCIFQFFLHLKALRPIFFCILKLKTIEPKFLSKLNNFLNTVYYAIRIDRYFLYIFSQDLLTITN